MAQQPRRALRRVPRQGPCGALELEAMIIILYIYAAGALLIALRLGWHMIFRLDRFDWECDKGNIWMTFLFLAVFWPLMVIIPRNLINPSKLFEGHFGLAVRMRLSENPPPCGSLIRYRQEHGWYTETYGEFLFQASHVEQLLRQRLAESPHLFNDDEGAIFNWLCRRNEALIEPTDVPSAWGRFDLIANYLVRNGSAKVQCLKCGIDIEQRKLVTKDDHGRPGWNFDRLACPNGHDLLVVKTGHRLVRSS